MKAPFFKELMQRGKDYEESLGEGVIINLSEEADKALGMAGAMLSGSKRTPVGKEDHEIYWNACVFDKNNKEIWYGDLDLTEKDAELKELASKVGPIRVTPESPFRFDGVNSKKLSDRDKERIKHYG